MAGLGTLDFFDVFDGPKISAVVASLGIGYSAGRSPEIRLADIVVVRDGHCGDVADDVTEIPAEAQPVGVMPFVVVDLVTGEKEQVGFNLFDVFYDVSFGDVTAMAGIDGIAGEGGDDNDVFVDGILFDGSRRPLPGQDEENRSTDIWLVRREVDGWSDPENVGTGMMYVTVNGEGTIYTTGRMGDGSDQGIVMHTFKDGVLGEAVGLGERVNYMQGTAHPYIAPDESYLIFDAQPNGIEAGPDLFISFKQEDGSWGRAVAFGDEVNKGSEMCATVSPDGRYMFFARDGDIFWVDAGIIDLMRVKVR